MFSLADTLQIPVVVRTLKCIFTVLATYVLARSSATSDHPKFWRLFSTNPNSGMQKTFWLLKSGILGLELGIQLKETGIPLTSESEIRNLESTTSNPESTAYREFRIQDCFGFPYKGRIFLTAQQLAPLKVALSGILVVVLVSL